MNTTDLMHAPMLGVAVAVALGLLVGLQREFADKRIGIRSFALIGGAGGIVGLLATEFGGWVLGAGLLSATIAIYGHAYLVSRSSEFAGMTTELAAIVMFLVGVLATSGRLSLAIVLGGGMTLLLHWKRPMHTLVSRIGEVEFEAMTRFVLITLVVLPILPNATFGPYAVLNPRQIWLMVVLIVSLNLMGYLAMKFSSGRGGVLLTGALGGLISSTAATVSFSTKGRESPPIAPTAALVILVASALVYVRILVEITVVAPGLLPTLAVPVAAFLVLFVVIVAVLFVRMRATGRSEDGDAARNPAELKTALSFTLLYALVLFVSAAVNEHFGESMLYPVAVVSGLTDVDAITLSIGRLFAQSRIDADAAWRIVFVAALSNLAFKTGIVAVIGGVELRRRLLPLLAVLLVAGAVGVWLWP